MRSTASGTMTDKQLIAIARRVRNPERADRIGALCAARARELATELARVALWDHLEDADAAWDRVRELEEARDLAWARVGTGAGLGDRRAGSGVTGETTGEADRG